MGKLRLFGHDWKVKYDNVNGAMGNWVTKEITINKDSESFVGHIFFHELIELSLGECSCSYYSVCGRDPTFILSHGDLDVLAKILYNSLSDNGLISEKKIKKLIEEK